MLLVALMGVTEAWAQNDVIRYTATEKLNIEWADVFDNTVNCLSHEYNSATHVGVVTFRGDITTIRDDAFSGCTSLTSIDLPAGVTSIGEDAFSGCTSLTSIDLPAGVTSIREDAFENCTSLTSIGLPTSLTSIVMRAFINCISLTSIDVPASVVEFGYLPFIGCTSLKSVTINSQQTINKVGYYVDDISGALKGHGWLTDTFGDQVEEIILKGNITEIPAEIFHACQIKTITIPATVQAIGNYAFQRCTQLESITMLPATPPTIKDMTFDEVDKTIPVYVPSSVAAAAYKAADGWKDFTNILSVSPKYAIEDKAEYSSDGYTLVNDLTYTRTFSSTQVGKWQPLFVPLDIEVTEELLGQCDIAMPYMVTIEGSISGGTNEDGGDDVLVLKKLKQGDTAQHGTPYFIRPKAAGNFSLEYADAHLYSKSEVTTLTCSTTLDNYAFVGQYAVGKPADGTTWYAINAAGSLQRGDDSSPDLPAQRWYMTKTSKSGVPAYAPARSMRITTFGEDEFGGTANAIFEVADSHGASPSGIYSLSGVRLAKPHKGLNIINGKKVMIK